MSQWDILKQNLPPTSYLILGAVILVVIGLLIYYIFSSRQEYPHSSDPHLGQSMFWDSISTALVFILGVALESYPVFLGIILVVLIMRFL